MKTSLKFALTVALVCLSAIWSMNAVDTGTGTPDVKALNAPGLQNLFALGTNVFSGSSPDGEEGFASLSKLGIKTIITVDGAKPDLELAHKYGLRYAHIPHGYDGIPTNVQAALAKVAQTMPGPIFVHCHHGIHRCPAAAAVICMAEYRWTPVQGEAWLKIAGTGTNYIGLFESVRNFRPPTEDLLRAIPPEFPESVRVSGLVDLMVEIDQRWDHLKAVRKTHYQTPKDQPDILPVQEAVILGEHFREAQRLTEASDHGADFMDRLKIAEAGVNESERLLRLIAIEPKPETHVLLDKNFDALAHTCASCHKSYRDPAGIKARK